MLEGVQRRATKLIPEITNLSYPNRLRAVDLPTLEYRRMRSDIIQVFRIMNGTDRYKKENLFKMASSEGNRTRGHKYKITKQRCNTSKRQRFFSNRIVDDWNKLPDIVVEANNVNTFKNRLDKHWNNKECKYCPSFMHE